MDKQWRLIEVGLAQVEVSDAGDVRTLDYSAPSRRAGQPTQLRRGTLLKPDTTSATGYPRVVFKRQGTVIRAYVHKLVAQAFVAGHFDGATVDHIDGDRRNNCASNLRWLSRSANSEAQNAAGRGAGRGEAHPLAKLKDADIPEIEKLRRHGWSLSEIATQFGVSVRLVHGILRGEKRVHRAQSPVFF